VDKAALIKPFKVLLSLHLLIAFDAKVVLHGGRGGGVEDARVLPTGWLDFGNVKFELALSF